MNNKPQPPPVNNSALKGPYETNLRVLISVCLLMCSCGGHVYPGGEDGGGEQTSLMDLVWSFVIPYVVSYTVVSLGFRR